ncbi:hypothetical protein [Gordonia sp. NPDC003585]|uniref:hypothetical protein n=1 Tax=Gordonia sp. NPDC003585 TaxID=3154275 RepID=UPI0033A11133
MAILRHTRFAPVVALFAATALVAGCATSSDSAGQAPVTVTVTSTGKAYPGGYGKSSSAAPSTVSRAGNYRALAAGFARVAGQTGNTVGIAIAPVGGKAVTALTLGDKHSRVAWSTIKVPLAVAAERENGQSAAETAAIVNSDNASAEALWASLGSSTEAARAVTGVLREGGDTTTVVPSEQRRAGFTIFGQTVWPLPAAATFTAHLPCMPGTEHVVSLMGQVAGNQQWGVEIMRTPTSTAVKGGWGPGESGGYLVRQIGLITHRDGTQTAVAMSAVGSSMGDGIAALNSIGNWLNRNVARLPRGRCAG